MDNVNYEEGYFKLKKSNEEFVILLNKVVSDLKQSKINCINERNKNSELAKQNEILSKELEQKKLECENLSTEISNLSDELKYLKTYSKAVEGVAENYCGKSLATQKKYNELKRQSSIFFENFTDGSVVFDMEDIDNDVDSVTPNPVYEIENIRKGHDNIMKEEKERFEKLLHENEEITKEKNEYRYKIEKLNAVIEDKDKSLEMLNADMDTLMSSYETLKADHDKMITYFTPFIKMKAENVELKRTSALLINNLNDGKTMEFLQIIEAMKEEITTKDLKIVEVERKLSEKEDSILEITALKTENDDLSVKYEALRKERDTLKHENRILLEQKGGFGVAPPPPPPLPPPPPPPQSKILKLFKKTSSKSNSSENKSKKPATTEDQLLCNLMNELETKLLEKVKRMNTKEPTKPSHPIQQKTFDSPDNTPFNVAFIKMRTRSEPNIKTPLKINEISELDRVLKKFNKNRIDENQPEEDVIN